MEKRVKDLSELSGTLIPTGDSCRFIFSLLCSQTFVGPSQPPTGFCR